MLRILLALSVLLFAYHSHADVQNGSKYQIYFDSHSFAYSETSSIKQIVVDDLEGPYFDGGEHSFTHNLWEIGAVREGWKLAYLIRYDYALDYNPDTAELIYRDKNDLSIEKNRIYELDLELVHTRVKGFKIGHQWRLYNQIDIQVDVTYLETFRFLEGEVNGQFEVAGTDYTGELVIDHVYSKDHLLKREVDKPTGRGYALDLAWNWQINSVYRLAGKFTDVVSEITFDKAPFTTATASTNRIDFDAEGKIDVKPVLSGLEGFRKHHLRLPRQKKLEAHYRAKPSLEVNASWYRYGNINFPSVGSIYSFNEEISLHSQLDFKSKAFTFGVASQSFEFSLTSDSVVLKKARTFGLDFVWRVGI